MPSRRYLYAALIVFAVYACDIIFARIQILSGATLPIHLGPVLQFLVLLLAVTLFVIATLGAETEAPAGRTSNDDGDKT